jgi:hypothetical protein
MLNMIIDMLGRVNTKTNNKIKAVFLFITISYKNKNRVSILWQPGYLIDNETRSFPSLFHNRFGFIPLYFSLLLSVK